MALIGIITGDNSGTPVTLAVTDRQGVSTGAGNSTLSIPANSVLPACLDTRDTVFQQTLGPTAEGSPVEMTRVRVTRSPQGIDRLSSLAGAELVGQSLNIVEVDIDSPVTNTIASPKWRLKGTMQEGTYLGKHELVAQVLPVPSGMQTIALKRYEGYGPAPVFPDGQGAYCTWETWDFTDATISRRFWFPLEDWDSGGTRTLFSNDDVKIQLVDRKVRLVMAFSGGNKTIDSYPLPRPEAWYWIRVSYLDSSLTLKLYVDGELINTKTGSGTRTKSGNTWTIGANQAASGEFFNGLMHDMRQFSAVIDEDISDQQEAGTLSGSETSLYAWLEGEMDVESATLDNAAVTDLGGSPNQVRIPATAHPFVAGQTVDIAGTTNYDGRYVIQAVAANTFDIESAFTSETLAGTETATGPGSLYDKAQVNASSPKDAAVVGCVRGSSLAGGVASGGNQQTAEAAGLTGSTRNTLLGRPFHVEMDLVDAENQIYGLGQGLRMGDIEAVFEAGVESTMTRVNSLLALYALLAPTVPTPALANVIAYAQEGLVAVTRGTNQGAITADVKSGASPFARSLKHDGVNDVVNYGTGPNSIFTDSFCVSAAVSFKVDDITSTHAIVSTDDGPTSIFTLQLEKTVGSPNPAQWEAVLAFDTGGSGAGMTLNSELTATEGYYTSEVMVTGTYVVSAPNTTITFKLFEDGVELDSDSMTIPTASIGASTKALVSGAELLTAPSTYWKFAPAEITELSIYSGGKTLAFHQRNLHRAQKLFLDGGGTATDEGSGLVSLPVANHPYVAGEDVEISGTTNYDGTETLHANTTQDRIWITATYAAETFDGDETVIPDDLAHYYPGHTWAFPASTLSDEGTATAADGTITGATWRGGVAPTSPRSLAAFLAYKAGVRGSEVDYTKAASWPSGGLDWFPTSDTLLTWDDILVELLRSFWGLRGFEADGTMILSWHEAPEGKSSDVTYAKLETHAWTEGANLPMPSEIAIKAARVHLEEDGSGLAGDTLDEDRSFWSKDHRLVKVPITAAPATAEPKMIEGWWHRTEDADTEARRQAAILGLRRYIATLALNNQQTAPTLGQYLEVTDQVDARATTPRGMAWRLVEQEGEVAVAATLWGLRDA